MRNWRVTAALLGLGIFCVPAFAANPARPGTVNYIEGSAYLDGQQLNTKSVGSTELDAGQTLTTGPGKAEILLTPGVYLRMDDRSAVKMISPDLTHTQVELAQGKASVEVDQLFPQNQVQIVDDGVVTQVVKPGYYEFDAANPAAMVFKGQAEVELGQNNWEKIKGNHELALAEVADGAHVKTTKFDTDDAKDDLYNWSSLRSQYLSQANNDIAQNYTGAGFYPGWYWDPYGWDYTFIGMDPMMSPFGWGFYPWGGWGGWGYWGGVGPGFYGRGIYRGGFGRGFHEFHGHGVAGGGFHGSGAGGGFHSGGFHGGGGFHDGGGRR